MSSDIIAGIVILSMLLLAIPVAIWTHNDSKHIDKMLKKNRRF